MSNGERYTLLSHKMQAGVGFDQATDPNLLHLAEFGPVLNRHLKHERVGINSTKVEIAAVARLLIDKGVFTEAEYWKAACDMMQAEVERYEALLTERFGRPVTLDTPFIDPRKGTRRV